MDRKGARRHAIEHIESRRNSLASHVLGPRQSSLSKSISVWTTSWRYQWLDLCFKLFTSNPNGTHPLIAWYRDIYLGLFGVDEGRTIIAVLHSSKTSPSYNYPEAFIVSVSKETKANVLTSARLLCRRSTMWQTTIGARFTLELILNLVVAKLDDCDKKIVFVTDGWHAIKYSLFFRLSDLRFTILNEMDIFQSSESLSAAAKVESPFNRPGDERFWKLADCNNNIEHVLADTQEATL